MVEPGEKVNPKEAEWHDLILKIKGKIEDYKTDCAEFFANDQRTLNQCRDLIKRRERIEAELDEVYERVNEWGLDNAKGRKTSQVRGLKGTFSLGIFTDRLDAEREALITAENNKGKAVAQAPTVGHEEDLDTLQEAINNNLGDLTNLEDEIEKLPDDFSDINALHDFETRLVAIRGPISTAVNRLQEHVVAYRDATGVSGVMYKRQANKLEADYLGEEDDDKGYKADGTRGREVLARIDRMAFRVWQLEIPFELPITHSLLEEVPPQHVDPDSSLSPKNLLNAWLSSIVDLEGKLAQAKAEFTPEDSIATAQKNYLGNEYFEKIEGSGGELERRNGEALNYWKSNLFQILPEVVQLDDYLNNLDGKISAIVANGEADQELKNIRDLVSSLEQAVNAILFPEDSRSSFTSVTDTHIAKARGVEGMIEGAKNEQGRLIEIIRDKIKEIRSKEGYALTQMAGNAIEVNIMDLRNTFYELRKTGIDEETYRNLEREIDILEFITIKGSVIKGFEGKEFNEDSAGSIDAYGTDVINPLFDSMEALCKRVDEPLKSRLTKEFLRFKGEMENLISFYVAAKVVREQALGTSGSATSEEMLLKFPTTLTVYNFGFTNGVLRSLLRAESGRCEDDDLRLSYERESNRIIENREVTVFDVTEGREVEKTVGITSWGNAMRDFDLFFQGRSPDGLSAVKVKHYWDRRRSFYSMSGKEIHQLVIDFERARLGVGDDVEIDISRKEAIRAWNASILLFRPFVQAPGSFNKSAPAYYAYSPDYLISEILGGTGDHSAFLYFSLFGFSNANLATPDNPDGVIFTLDAMSEKADAHTVAEKVVNVTSATNIRESIIAVFKEKGLYDKYSYLCDLPLLPLSPKGLIPNEDGVEKALYLCFSDPLTNMMFKRPGSDEYYHLPGEDGNPDDENRYLVGDDFIDKRSVNPKNPNGSILYEEIPLTDPGNTKDIAKYGTSQQETDQIRTWINGASNIEKFSRNVLYAKPGDIAESAVTRIAEMTKESKYALDSAQPYAPYVRTGEISSPDNIRTKITLTVAFVQGILLLNEGKTMSEVRKRFATFNVKDKDGLEAVLVALEAGFGTSEKARAALNSFANQISERLKVR